MREQNPPGYILAVLADFRHQASLSKVLHGAAVPATPLTIARLQKLADLVGYRVRAPRDLDHPFHGIVITRSTAS